MKQTQIDKIKVEANANGCNYGDKMIEFIYAKGKAEADDIYSRNWQSKIRIIKEQVRAEVFAEVEKIADDRIIELLGLKEQYGSQKDKESEIWCIERIGELGIIKDELQRLKDEHN